MRTQTTKQTTTSLLLLTAICAVMYYYETIDALLFSWHIESPKENTVVQHRRYTHTCK